MAKKVDAQLVSESGGRAKPLAVVASLDATFDISRSIKNMNTFIEKIIAAGDFSPEKVTAACLCQARINETIDSTRRAAEFFRGKEG